MNRRRLLIGSTVMIGCLYSCLFYVVFASEEPKTQSVLLQSEQADSTELHWLQAGLFKEESSYEALKDELMNAGFQVFCVKKDELTAVVVEPVQTFHENYQHSLKLKELGIEVILKNAKIDDQQRTKISHGQMENVLMELMNP